MKRLKYALLLIIVFFLGLLSTSIYGNLKEGIKQFPFGENNNTDIVPSPSSWINEKQINVYNDRIIIDLKNAEWAVFADTHSMEPVLSSRSYGIEVVPKSEDEIKVGDIVSYQSDYSDGIIIHRVVLKDKDEKGTYFILKGDNNPTSDPGKVRFSQIKRVLVGILY